MTWGGNGQFFTPEPITQLMAQMVADPPAKTACNPAVGSCRNLLAYADINRNAEFYGQDVDLRYVRMTALNLAFRNLYGWVIHGDSLKNERRRFFRTGFNGRGFIAEVAIGKVPEPTRAVIEEKLPEARTQMSLF